MQQSSNSNSFFINNVSNLWKDAFGWEIAILRETDDVKLTPMIDNKIVSIKFKIFLNKTRESKRKRVLQSFLNLHKSLPSKQKMYKKNEMKF